MSQIGGGRGNTSGDFVGIKIKKSKRGSLHKALGISKNKKIPASKLVIKKTDSPAVKKKKIFAQNAKKFNHKKPRTIVGPLLGSKNRG